MTAKTEWKPVNLDNATYLGSWDFADNHCNDHIFEVFATPDKLVFGVSCFDKFKGSAAFMQSGYMERKSEESQSEATQALWEEFAAYFNDGPEFATRIIANERIQP